MDAEIRGRVKAVADCVSAMLARIVKNQPLLRVIEGSCEVAHPEQRELERVVGAQEDLRIQDLLT
jgi:hypothetical protein